MVGLARRAGDTADEAAFAAARHGVTIAEATQEGLVPLVKHLPGALLIRDRNIVFKRNEAGEDARAGLVAAVGEGRVIGCDFRRAGSAFCIIVQLAVEDRLHAMH